MVKVCDQKRNALPCKSEGFWRALLVLFDTYHLQSKASRRMPRFASDPLIYRLPFQDWPKWHPPYPLMLSSTFCFSHILLPFAGDLYQLMNL